MTLRLAQWGTGKVGKYTLRGVIDHPELDLVAIHAFSPVKWGKTPVHCAVGPRWASEPPVILPDVMGWTPPAPR